MPRQVFAAPGRNAPLGEPEKNTAEMLEKQGKHRETIREYEALISSEGVGEEEVKRARARIEILKKSDP